PRANDGRPGCGKVRDRHPARRTAFDADNTTHELEIGFRNLELLSREIEELLTDLAGSLDHGPAVVHGRLRPARTGIPRAGVRILVEDREILGLHSELLCDEERHAHHTSCAVLLCTRDDGSGAVGVQLDVRPGVVAEGGPPAASDANRLVFRKLGTVSDQVDSPLERLLHPERVEYLASRSFRALFDQRAAPKVD